jgi:hypothetical protein
MSPPAAFKADDAGQVGIVFKEGREQGINPPEYFSGLKMLFQQTQHGQRLDDVTE